ncbi:hypothetical protein [Paraconexibacter sp. AEG42_29]
MSQTHTAPAPQSVAIRTATPDDSATIVRLAALDSSAVPAGPHLIGTVDGVPAAAISLSTGAVVADPFTPTAALVALLRMRAEHLRGPARSPGGLRGAGRIGLSVRGRRALT